MLRIDEPTDVLRYDDDAGYIFENTQELSSDFISELSRKRNDFAFRLDGLTPVASVPAAVVNRWIREGFDFHGAPAQEIKLKLKIEEMTNFDISYGKSF